MEGYALNEKGAPAHSTTYNEVLNLFFKMLRSTEVEDLNRMLDMAWNEDALLTLKVIFHARDPRGGKGEREQFRRALKWLYVNKFATFQLNVMLVPEFGRWDDLYRSIWIEHPEYQESIAMMLLHQYNNDIEMMNLKKPVSLMAKWMPTENGSFDKLCSAQSAAQNTGFVKTLCKYWSISPKQYRRQIGSLRTYIDVTEKKMCAGNWTGIDYSKVPSQCMLKNRKAFSCHDPEFASYLANVAAGKAKINSGTLHVHQMVVPYLQRSTKIDLVLEEQWKSKMQMLKQSLCADSLSKALAIVDVSGSMTGEPLHVAIALGLVISELAAEPFNNIMLTFHSSPTFHTVVGETLMHRVRSVANMSWGNSTNFQAAFDLILNRAVLYKLPSDQMPKILYVFSDMQFDSAAGVRSQKTNLQVIREQYAEHGYTMPQIVFWNLRGNTSTFPATILDNGVVMVSGFSVDLLDSILEGDELTPVGIMQRILNKPRYDVLKISLLRNYFLIKKLYQ